MNFDESHPVPVMESTAIQPENIQNKYNLKYKM
jgi:hypothetical protein